MNRLQFSFWLAIFHVLWSLGGDASGQCPPGQFCPLPQYGSLVQVPRQSSAPAQVVRIRNQQGNTSCLGSGTLVDKNDQHGLVLSCGHLFGEGVGTVTVIFPDGKQYGAKVLEADTKTDLSALLIQAPECEPWDVAENAPKPGEPIYSAGYGQQGSYAVNAGTVRGYVGWNNSSVHDALSISGSARQGDSGGPMYDRENRVVGVLCGTSGTEVDGPCCLRIRKFLERHCSRFRRKPAKPAVPAPSEKYVEPAKPIEPPAAPAVDPRIAEYEKQIATAEAARKKLQDELAAAQNKPPTVIESPPVIVEKIVEKAAATGLTAVLTPFIGPAALIAGPAAAALFGGLWWRARGKLKARIQARRGETEISTPSYPAGTTLAAATHVIREAAPPAPLSIEERHHNHYVEIPVSKTDEAWAKAHSIYSNAYPGSYQSLKAVERLKDQILKGEPTTLPSP